MEQAVMWLMNRARQDPAAEGVRLAISSDPEVAGGRDAYQVNLSLLQSEFAGIAPKPPAAFDVRLYTAALAHSEDLIGRDAQDHAGQFEHVAAAGFQYTRCRGNVFSFATSALNAHSGFNIDWGPGEATGMQPGRGHRQAIMGIDGDYTNVGVAAVPENDPRTRVGPLVVSGNYCNAQVNTVDHFNRFVVGTVWQDLNGNGRYDPGEGFGDVTVRPDRGGFFAVTAAGGGYAIPITAPGDYVVTFSGGAVPAASSLAVTVGGTSVLLDHVVGSASPALTVRLNESTFHAGQTMTLTATLTPGSSPAVVDAYVVIRLPDGTFWSLTPHGTTPGIVPLATRFTAASAGGELARVMFTGREAAGTYTWFAALTQPGTLTVVGDVMETSFTFDRSHGRRHVAPQTGIPAEGPR